MQVLFCLHNMLEAVDLDDALLRLGVAVRLALLLEGSQDPWTAAAVLKQVSSPTSSFITSCTNVMANISDHPHRGQSSCMRHHVPMESSTCGRAEEDRLIQVLTASIVHLPARCSVGALSCTQGKHAAEASRARVLGATKYARDEHVRWISAARSQPSQQAQQLLQGGRGLELSVCSKDCLAASDHPNAVVMAGCIPRWSRQGCSWKGCSWIGCTWQGCTQCGLPPAQAPEASNMYYHAEPGRAAFEGPPCLQELAIQRAH